MVIDRRFRRLWLGEWRGPIVDAMQTTDWLRRDESIATMRSIGQVVREYRLAAGVNQGTVAEAMGLTQQFLSQVEKGSRKATLEHRRDFARILGIPPEELGLAPPARGPVFTDTDPAVAASRGRWRAQRHWLNSHRSDLARMATLYYDVDCRLPRTSLISGDGWVPAAPMELDSIRLRLDERARTMEVTGAEQQTRPVRPLRLRDIPFESYSAAVRHLDPPRLFESRPSYRYLGGTIADGSLDFGLAAYFDKLDVSEALAHETAAACLAHPETPDLRCALPFREFVGDPFDAARRAIIPAITTLTIRLRRFPEPPSFLLHWRDPERVATAAGVYDVIPAGEFQPSGVALWDRHNDFSLWRNIVREYSEELLGHPEHDGTRSTPIDYANWPLFQSMGAARTRGTMSVHLLGFGLDALTLAATLLTVVVVDNDVFDDIFGSAVRFNDEGEIVGIGDGRGTDGVPFTREAVTRMLDTEPIAAPGAACLALAWQHRHSLIG
ncbi:helix-turn-helix domain-containing protein [Nocardia harenae]|uniref:helix-turn-helix domain-containing protein n=1 Tax=Nocardia harenae TaxID=358707 RepID=UPI000829C454|nr:helix-turn-helix transcriptional regulator [Nocardia harenae]